MSPTRRTILTTAGALPLLAGGLGFSALAQTSPTPAAATDIPPVLFVHGNGDHAALWITTLWRMESNGVPRERMLAINFTDPLARTDDKVEQANRSSTEDQRRGREAGRADGLGHDIAIAGCGSWTFRGRPVQPRADRGAGLAGVGKPDCGGRTDLLAVLATTGLCEARIKDIVGAVARMSEAICGAWRHPGYRFAHPGFCNGPWFVNPFCVVHLPGTCFCTGSALRPSPDGVHERSRPANLRKRGC